MLTPSDRDNSNLFQHMFQRLKLLSIALVMSLLPAAILLYMSNFGKHWASLRPCVAISGWMVFFIETFSTAVRKIRSARSRQFVRLCSVQYITQFLQIIVFHSSTHLISMSTRELLQPQIKTYISWSSRLIQSIIRRLRDEVTREVFDGAHCLNVMGQ